MKKKTNTKKCEEEKRALICHFPQPYIVQTLKFVHSTTAAILCFGTHIFTVYLSRSTQVLSVNNFKPNINDGSTVCVGTVTSHWLLVFVISDLPRLLQVPSILGTLAVLH